MEPSRKGHAMTALPSASAPKMSESRPGLSWLASTLISGNLLLLVLVVWAFVRFGSIPAALHVLNGEPIIVDSNTKSFGKSKPDQRVRVEFQLTNHGSEPVRVVGSRIDCSCIVLDDKPFQIESGGTHPFELTIGLPKEPQKVHRTLSLFTNVPGQQQVDLVVVGEVIAPATDDD
jgi:Protein of unknown function (DUF1573)